MTREQAVSLLEDLRREELVWEDGYETTKYSMEREKAIRQLMLLSYGGLSYDARTGGKSS